MLTAAAGQGLQLGQAVAHGAAVVQLWSRGLLCAQGYCGPGAVSETCTWQIVRGISLSLDHPWAHKRQVGVCAVASTYSQFVSAHREELTKHASSSIGIRTSAGPIDLAAMSGKGSTAGCSRLTGGALRSSSCCRQMCLLSCGQASLGRQLSLNVAEQGVLGPWGSRCKGLVGSALLVLC